MLIKDFEELHKNLIEMRSFYLRQVDEIYRKNKGKKRMSSNDTWALGKAHGGVEACDALILACFGGGELMALMEMQWEAQSLADELDEGER